MYAALSSLSSSPGSDYPVVYSAAKNTPTTANSAAHLSTKDDCTHEDAPNKIESSSAKSPQAMDDASESTAVQFHFWVYRLLYMNGYLFHEADDYDNVRAIAVAMACMLSFTHFSSVQDFVLLAFLGNQLYHYYQIFPSLANHSNLQVIMCLIMIPDHLQRCVTKMDQWCGALFRFKPKEQQEQDEHSMAKREDEQTRDTVGAMRWIIAILYFFAGFHKINSDFFDLEVTCAFEMVDRLLVPFGIEAHAHFPHWLQVPFPPVVIFLELTPAVLFVFFPKWQKYGVLMLLMLHGPLSFVGFADFSSIGMGNLYVLIAPLATQYMPSKEYFKGIILCFVAAHLVMGVEKQIDAERYENTGEEEVDYYGIYEGAILVLAFTPIWYQYFRSSVPGPTFSIPTSWWNRLVPALFVFFCMNNYLGLRTAGTVSMFSNLRTEGPRSNHYLLGSNPLKFFDYQDDLVYILEADERVSERYRYQMNAGVIVPWIQFCRNVEDVVWEEHEDLYAKIEYQGEMYETYDMSFDTNFTSHFKIPWWQSFLLEFREIYEPDQKQECTW